jgi:UDP-glucose 4-epimerase
MCGLMSRTDLFGEVFNIGSTEEISMMRLAERVRRATGSSSDIVRIPYDEAYGEGFEDMARRVPDTGKIAAALDWRPTLTLDQILADVVEHERSRISGPRAPSASAAAAADRPPR